MNGELGRSKRSEINAPERSRMGRRLHKSEGECEGNAMRYGGSLTTKADAVSSSGPVPAPGDPVSSLIVPDEKSAKKPLAGSSSQQPPSVFEPRAQRGDWPRQSPRRNLETLASRLLERLHGRRFVVLYVEHCVELGDLKQIVHFLGQIQQLQFAALILRRREGTDQFADP